MLFGISHYAGQVFYHGDTFVEKNVSELPSECFDMMASSQNTVLEQLALDIVQVFALKACRG